MDVVNEKYVEIDYNELNLEEKDLDELCKLGLSLIKDDRRALIEYTVNKLMTDLLGKLHPETNEEEKIDMLKNYIKIRI